MGPDALVANLLEKSDISKLNAALHTWTKNGEALPDGITGELRDFMEHARQLLSWTDPGKLTSAIESNDKRGLTSECCRGSPAV